MRCFCFSLFFIILLSSATSQDLEVGIFGGGAYYLGDVNPSDHFQGTRLAYGILARYTIDDRWAVKLGGTFARIAGSSAGSRFLPDRNLQFESPVTDISAVAEFNFFPFYTGSRRNFITPYVYAGVGMFFFKPSSGGVELQPLGTEGQQSGYEGRKPYSLTGIDIPFGLGVKVSLSRRIAMSASWEMHKTFTDYLDDISRTYYLDGTQIDPGDPTQFYSDPAMNHLPGMQRGNSQNQDWYSLYGIAITYKFALDGGRRCRDVYNY